MNDRLGHCTPTFGGHSPLCDRDGRYCSLVSTHSGPCKPHGGCVDGGYFRRPGDPHPAVACDHCALCDAKENR